MEAIGQFVAVALQATTLFRGEIQARELRVGVSQLLLVVLLPAGAEEVLDPAQVQIEKPCHSEGEGCYLRCQIILHIER